MSDEVRAWLRYADENLRVATLCLDEGLYNPAIQNAQQAVEKALKAMCLCRGLTIKNTHSIGELTQILYRAGIDPVLAGEECALLDSVYLPSKYPLGSVLPDYEPDQTITLQCLSLAERTVRDANKALGPTGT